MRFYIPCFSMVALLLLGYFVLFHCFWMLYSHPEQGIGQSVASPQASATDRLTNDTSGLMASEGTTTTVGSTAILPPASSDGPLPTKKAGGKSPDLSQSTRSTNRSEQQGGVGGAFLRGKMSWDAFADMPLPGLHQFTAALPHDADDDPLLLSKAIDVFDPVMCSDRVSQDLKRPRLTSAEFDWCIWALSQDGGKVVVGQSWGRLSNKADHLRFDRNNCNAVKSGKNPSCDDSWGDKHVRDWISNQMHSVQCDAHRKSRVNCHLNDNSDKFCSIINAQISFQQYAKVSRGSYTTSSKQFERNFLSADCSSSPAVQSQVPFRHLFSTTAIASGHCDLVYNGTLLLFSHDDIRNLGHTLNDIFNVWMMLWLEGLAPYARQVDLLNVDSFKLGHNFDDKPNHFFLTYSKSLHDILRGVDFGRNTLCVKKLVLQPLPPRFFIWESWFTDLPCSFVGPSSLYQRWNLHVRHSYGLLQEQKEVLPLNSSSSSKMMMMKVLVIERKEFRNLWGRSRTSRSFLNLPAILSALNSSVAQHGLGSLVQVEAHDLAVLSFEQQVRLIGESAIVVGMHGAGIASSMHMAIGSKLCCGVVEIYPSGEFSPIRGHGNMARKMGLLYDRMDIDADLSQHDGASVPKEELSNKVVAMIKSIRDAPTCVVADVRDDPYLIK